jgi:hypothetical protein
MNKVITAAKKPCPVLGCEEAVKTAYLMCAFHWGRVPVKLQREVYKTFRAWPYSGTYEAYQDAASRAIKAAA